MPTAKRRDSKPAAEGAKSSSAKPQKSDAVSKRTKRSGSSRSGRGGIWAGVPAVETDQVDALTAVFDSVLLLLVVGAVGGSWVRQFKPIHGEAWKAAVPSAKTVLYAPATLFAMLDLRDAVAVLPLSSGPFSYAPWVFLSLAFVQPLQFTLGGLLDPSASVYALAVLVAAFTYVLRISILRTWIALDEDRRTPEWLLRGASILVYPSLAWTIGEWAFSGNDPLGLFLIPKMPAWLLPETWAVPLAIGIMSMARAVLRFRAQLMDDPEPKKRGGADATPSMRPLFTFAGLCALPLMHGLLINTHSPLGFARDQVAASLATSNFTMIKRADGGGTGYVSVLHNDAAGYKVMRCGHSLLGGVWDKSEGLVKEPIYAVFVMLEAVRLMMPKGGTRKVERNAQALNIGLGVGTAPQAFIMHGVNTTIVELDQNVYDMAVSDFSLPKNHTTLIRDAVPWVQWASRPYVPATADLKSMTDEEYSRLPPAKQWDYILHDVFTGGVEPAALFTYDFLSQLRRLLKNDGSIAINYAGDLSSPVPHIVIRTIFHVFGNNCQVFRETESPGKDSSGAGDQTNIVVFCRKDDKPFVFDKPIKADFLGTNSRKHYLVPKHAVPLKSFKTGDLKLDRSKLDLRDKGTMLWSANVGLLEALQHEAGTRHWQLMREVVPRDVWVNY